MLPLIEMTVDKVPVVDTIHDGIKTFVRPVAGAVLFDASGNVVSEVNPALALICGLLVAEGVYAVKTTAWPVITTSTVGTGNPLVSAGEDVVSAGMAIVAIVLPVLAAAVVLLMLVLFVRWYMRRKCRWRRA